MARSLVGTNLRAAIDINGSYYMLARADVYPSRVYFEAITSDYPPVVGADAIGLIANPMKQDIEYSPIADGLVTFFVDSGLKCMVQGSNSVISLSTDYTPANVKPGVLDSTLYYLDTEGYVNRCSINWTGPTVSDIDYVSVGTNVIAVHAVGDDESVAILDDEGGFRPVYISGVNSYLCPTRFMFPSTVISSGSSRSMDELGELSGVARLGNKIFVYISNCSNGSVEGMYYDVDTSTWSDIFIALPTDLDTSLCEFRIANVYTHNGTIYMCGQFGRTDFLSSARIYSLLLYSDDGKVFTVERNTLVSDIGYRYLARVGNKKLYLGNCNRVCSADVTWVFDGTSGSEGRMTAISSDDFKAFTDTGLSKSTLTLRSGLEQYFGHLDVLEGSRMRVYAGMKTSVGDEYVLYGTYIIDTAVFGLASGKRDTVVSATNEAEYRLTGLTMPFYAEIAGKSMGYCPMKKDSTMMENAVGGCRTETKFSLDMWKHEGYSSGAIVGIDIHRGGGVDVGWDTANHNYGIITNSEIKDILLLESNPKITGTSIHVHAYGWSHEIGGGAGDLVKLLLIVVDENDVETVVLSTGDRWNQTYTSGTNGTPIEFTIGGLTVGHRIKKAGLTFEGTAWFCPARLDFISGTEAYFSWSDANTPWTQLDSGDRKLPRPGRPYIDFAQKPYNSFNFSLAASFSNSVVGAFSGFPVAAGLVGHAENGANYTVGRYNKANNKVELVLCRDGKETTLQSNDPPFPIQDMYEMRFDHRNGRFEVFMFNTSGSFFQSALTYEWREADGYMFTSRLASMQCGIYGCIMSPYVPILGYYSGESDNAINADGLPIAPLYDLDDFPTSGSLRLTDDIYSYESKIVMANPIGPYQLRNKDVGTGEAYMPPLGIGKPGLECRAFDWTADPSSCNDYLIAMNDGSNFICIAALWQVYITTGGSPVVLPNRARFYSENIQIGKLYHTLATKVWITGGFKNVNLLTGKNTRIGHSEGEVVYYALSGEIKCQWYMGSGGEDDTTIGDMIQKICDLSGARCSFPSDITIPSLGLTSGSFGVSTIAYAEGFDISFESAGLATNDDINIAFNAKLRPDNYTFKSAIINDTQILLNINYLGSGNFRYYLLSMPSATVLYACDFASALDYQKFRIKCLMDGIGIYQNGQWVTTIALDKVDYGDNLTLSLSSYSSETVSNILISNLSDWREAVWIDLETDGRSALGSVIQQRPIEIIPHPDGSVSIYYEKVRDQIIAVREPRDHKYQHSIPAEGASDAIVYGYNVKTLQNLNFARELGFSTKLFRMPDLSTGAVRAANVLLQRALEGAHRDQLTIRPDLALVIGDVYVVIYTASGTGRIESHIIILESISLEARMSGPKSSSRMAITGREVYVE